MAVDAAMVERVARLARLRLAPGEAAHLESEINGILGWIEQLQQVDTDGVAPMTAVIPNHLRLREDRSEEHTSELQSLMRISYAVFCLKKKKQCKNKKIVHETS